MDRILLWALLIIGMVLLFISLRKPLIKDMVLVYLMKGYISSFFGIIVAEEKWVEYPVRFLGQYFKTSIIFEYFLYPIMCVYLYRTSYRSSFLGIIVQCALYASAMTILEVVCEKYTNLVKYHTWTWMYSFLTIFLLSFMVRMLMQWINKREQQLKG
ncbi:hypothetical protein G3578_16315 [Brevibacillus sp. SYP-B805]|uniref:CBO0543 family protein n=1 Tax=Brevibacillus sp. SYP-B805 TaxID=1578199 RepID=UPI0013E9C6A4|nr:CBO0543 family protein [Brevibacillus sp. SYP-B805]NGQ96730.1 hypothetical protein [Brevibacillus sp. SYP-B805]